MKFAILVLAAITFPVSWAMIAQTPAAPTPAAQTVDAPKLTEVQSLKLENLKLKYQQYSLVIANAQSEQTKLQKEYQDISDEITKMYPGYSLDNSGALVKTPPPTQAKTEPKK